MAGALLAGTTVLDTSTVGPASRCAALLADLGADVVKVGPPPSSNRIVPEPHAYSAGRGTRRIGIDLKDDDGRDVFLRLAAGADVVLESFRPGVADRLGIGYDDVQAVNPGVVYAALTGYGQDGPYAGWAGHDLNYQAVTGVLACQGRRADGGPALPGATVADSAGGGMHAALSIAAALVRRMRTGEGAYLNVAAVDGMLSLMSLAVDEYLATGAEPAAGTTLLTGRYACYDTYRARDGRWLAVGAIERRFFANLCEALGHPEHAPHQYDGDRQDTIRADLAAAFATRDRDDWVAALAGADTCVAPVLSVAEVATDPHVRARGLVTEVHAEDGLSFLQLGPVLAGTHDGGRPQRAVPPTRSDAPALLAEAGLDTDAVDDLRRREVIR